MVSVEKLCKSVWENMWERRGKVIHMLSNGEFYTFLVVKLRVFHVVVEKFYHWFCTWFYRYENGFYTVSTALTTTTTNYLEKDI